MDSRRCPRCETLKPTADFYPVADRPSGFSQYCKDCTREKRRRYYLENRELETQRRIAWAKKNPDKQRAAQQRSVHKHWASRWKRYHADKSLQAKYGITIEEFEVMVEECGGRCALCGHEKKLCIDHSHITGRVRGLLCIRCNGALGQLVGDLPDNVEKIRTYLMRGI